MSASKTRILLFSGALILFVLLFIAPRTLPKNEKQEGKEAESDIAAIEVYRDLALKNLQVSDKELYDSLKEVKNFDSLQHFWLSKKRPDLGALEAELKAIESGKSEDYTAAGNRYYNAVRFTNDQSEIPALFQGAIRNFRKALEKDPDNTDAKIMLASSYVEGSSEPMEGIKLLREVERSDSNNIQMQLSFAFFSVKSGQTGKAIERFEKVLAIDSNYIEAYLHLADVHEREGNTGATIAALEEYTRRTSDITARIEVQKYIQQLKTKLNN